MSVKKELDIFLKKLLKLYEATPEGLPLCPRRKDIDQIIYVGKPDDSGWCKWKPIEQKTNEKFLSLMNMLKIDISDEIIEYFTSYYFLSVDLKFKSYIIGLSEVAPGDEFKRLKERIERYKDEYDGKIKYIPIGVEEEQGYSVVIEVKTGIIKFADFDKRRMRKICSNLQEFIKNSEPII